MVENPPIITLYISSVIFISGFIETIPPITSPAKESFAKSKNNPASFSRLTLSFSFTSFFASCCSLQLPMHSYYNKYEYTGILLLLSSSWEISDNTNFLPKLDLLKSEMFFLEERGFCFNLILPIPPLFYNIVERQNERRNLNITLPNNVYYIVNNIISDTN